MFAISKLKHFACETISKHIVTNTKAKSSSDLIKTPDCQSKANAIVLHMKFWTTWKQQKNWKEDQALCYTNSIPMISEPKHKDQVQSLLKKLLKASYLASSKWMPSVPN